MCIRDRDYIGCPALRDWDPGRSLEEEWLGKYIASNDGVQRIVVATVPPDAGKEFVERGNPIFVPESVPGPVSYTHLDDDVAELVGTMNSPKKVKYQGPPEPVTPRERYVRAVEIVADLLLSDMSRRATGSSAEAILQMAGRRDRAQ